MAARPPEEPSRASEQKAAAARIRHQASWVDLQIRQAVERGDFEDLPGYGKPLDLGREHDPDWWVKRMLEREQVTVVPPSVQLRREDAELDGRLDRLSREADVRREVTEFNDRVRWALYRPPEGPPVVTSRRDPDEEVERWRARRSARQREAAARSSAPGAPPPPRRRPWWRRGRG